MSQITEILTRLQRTHSQAEIASKTGISQPKLSRWASGAVAAGADDALKLLAFDRKSSRNTKPKPKPLTA